MPCDSRDWAVNWGDWIRSTNDKSTCFCCECYCCFLCNLRPQWTANEPQTLSVFPKYIPVSLTTKDNGQWKWVDNGREANWELSMGCSQVYVCLKRQDLRTQSGSRRGKKDSFSYSVVAPTFSKEGYNLGAASMHCVPLFPFPQTVWTPFTFPQTLSPAPLRVK